MPWLGYACGTCDYCVSGRETLCESQQNMGYSIDGAFGEYAVAYARYVVKVPDGIDAFDAAPLTCAGVTTYKAVKVAGTRSSDLVAVFGVGGLGHLAIQYAAIAGARVIAVDLLDEKLQLALRAGRRVHPSTPPARTPWRRSRHSGASTRQLRSRSRRGHSSRPTELFAEAARSCSWRSPPTTTSTLPISETVLNGLTIVGSIVGTRTDFREVFELHAAGETKVIRELRPLSRVSALTLLHRSRSSVESARGRLY